LVFAGIAGGTAIALGLALILHPSLLPRQILLGVFALLFLALTFVSSLIPHLSTILCGFGEPKNQERALSLHSGTVTV
jgi:hypothetical protein